MSTGVDDIVRKPARAAAMSTTIHLFDKSKSNVLISLN